MSSSVKTLFFRKLTYKDVLEKYLHGRFSDEKPLKNKQAAVVATSTATVEVSPGVAITVIRTPREPGVVSNKCYHCHGDIPVAVKDNGGGIGVPYELNKTPSGHEVHSYGFYCRAECELGAAIKKRKKFPNAEKILRSLYSRAGITSIVPAPPYTARKIYGGPLDDLEYYKNRHHYTQLPGYVVRRVEVTYQRQLDAAMMESVINSTTKYSSENVQ